jgi:ribosomal protein S18 acetylase RimI-like enzyme
MIRDTLPTDTPALLALTKATGVFKPIEIEALEEVLADYHAANRAGGHYAVTWERDGDIIGFAYFAPAAMTDGTWNLWWIVVRKADQAGGIGGQLLRHVEEHIQREHGRHLLVETSSLPHYASTRRFYEKHGYHQTAMVPDYYSEGDGMVIYRKRFSF